MRPSYARNVVRCVLVALTSLVMLGLSSRAGAESPFGLPKRVPWNSKRLMGSPEPPLPYTVEKTFTKLTWKTPIYLADEQGTDHLWVIQEGVAAEQGSRIVRIKDDPDTTESELILELPKYLVYSVCFHPDYLSNGYVYLFRNGPRSAPERMNQIIRYTVDRQAPHKIVPMSEELILEWQSSGHDGGDMTFGRDGMFYITTGDGSSDSDTYVSGQTLNDLLGSVLRIDVNKRVGKQPYAVPSDNPFISTPGARPEIWAYGLRNPWRMGCDAKTGQIWVGTNGQDQWETAHLIGRGENYGWSVYEGSHPFYLERKRGPTPHVLPTIEHSHAEFRSLTGGVVYYGDKLPDLNGAYIYGDYGSGRIWGMKHDGQRVHWHRELADTPLQIASFRVNHHGELLIVDHGGGIVRLVPAPKEEAVAPFPTLLSQTGLFASTAEHKVDPAIIPYSVNAPGWTDGARAEHFMAVPGELKVGFDSGRGWEFPDHTALVQSLSLEREPGNAESRFRVETRVMLRQQGEWAGYSYRWNEEQTDATLVTKNGEDAEFAVGGPESQAGARQKWRFPSRSECMACHSRAAGFVLGLTGSQLNREHEYDGIRDNQIRALDHIGLFSKALPKAPKDLDTLIDPRDPTQDLERRARTYLQVNCSVCHIEAGGGNAKMVLALSAPREQMGLLDARPQHDTFGISDAMLVAPGDPERSALLRRLSIRGRGQMPPLVTNRVDEQAVTLMRDWIAQLKPQHTFVQAWEMGDLLPELDHLKSGRSIDTGRKAFRDTGCIQCHRFEGEGGSVGPDLTGVGRRLDTHNLLESILLPSKVIADEYAGVLLETADGAVVTGRVEREDDQVVVLRPPGAADLLSVEKANILQRRRSELSNMPLGIVNVLRKEQVLDLIAYLMSDPAPAKSSTK
ncbi:PQQ-dependent sugar dehydrogenase [Singulisphaera acidiphila]|uniref:Putative heme-binding domain-containing protein n=1 Tax=Singulisphaera acidiphila (strain ATCC BAA-1392 / DSM 18658 / VKM B-2454 / MOB10) TaxID=886293 RepID=L0DBK5_SINAD|nr:PQQ-dependent sugar dehydrogenase [Singulisphaera acidiphila]AGA26759.1 putative heme-binding domain-containing protein [Singulisphaera acidiphila DSM 18658]